jgi:hypothetical protein
MRTSFLPYFGLEGLGSLELDNAEEENVRILAAGLLVQLTSMAAAGARRSNLVLRRVPRFGGFQNQDCRT